MDDFRLPPDKPEWTYALVGAVAVLVTLRRGLVCRRGRISGAARIARRRPLVWIILPAGIYIEAKLLAILSATLVLLALVGGWSLSTGGRVPEAALLVLAATIGIFVRTRSAITASTSRRRSAWTS